MENKKLLMAALIAATPITSHALDYSVSGFGSLVGGATTDGEEFRPHVKYGGGKYDESFALDVESRLGVQGRVQLTDDLAVTAQVVSRGAYNWRPELKWAYVSYQVNDNVQVKAGRLNAPFYLFSDFQDVGYALPWVSAPRNAYMVPADSIEGVNVITSFSTEKFEHVIELYAGRYDDSQNKYEAAELGVEAPTFGFSYMPTYDGWLTMRVTYHEVDLDLYSEDLDGLNAGLKGPLSGSPEFIANTESKNQRASFSGLAVKAELDRLTLIAELNQLEWHTSIFPHQKRGYISAIYQVNDKFSPYVTLMKNSDTGGDIGTITEVGPFTNAALAAQFGESDTFGWAIGGRYEIADNMALKAEYQSQSSDISKNERTAEDVADTFRVGLDIIF